MNSNETYRIRHLDSATYLTASGYSKKQSEARIFTPADGKVISDQRLPKTAVPALIRDGILAPNK